MLCHADYPNRLSYKLIDEAGIIVKKKLDGSITDRQSNEQLGSLIARYDDPGSLDKLSQVNTRVEEVKLKLNDNITSLVSNQVDVEVAPASPPEARGQLPQPQERSDCFRKGLRRPQKNHVLAQP